MIVDRFYLFIDLSALMTKNMHRFRIAIVGSHRVRVAKVVSILSSLQNETEETKSYIVEYVPCVATFDSYENEHGDTIRYLMKLEHHANAGKTIPGLTLAPFFDELCNHEIEGNDDKSGEERIPGIAGVAIGCGIELKEDVEKINSFLNTLLNNSTSVTDEKNQLEMLVKCIEPNDDFQSMAEENKFYKKLNAEEKEQVTELESLGPGKMARFIRNLTEEMMGSLKPNEEQATEEVHECNDEVDTCEEQQPNDNFEKQVFVEEYESNVTRFACKICRTILFSENELENPPHTKAQHDFSSRKSRMVSSRSKCESVFLQDGLDWMGDISESIEGKITCHHCKAKLGLWKWTGGQCSCGRFI